MKKLTVALAFLPLFAMAENGENVVAQGTNYVASIDLNKVESDKIKVDIVVPKITKEEVEYHMPKIVPGTYSISDFGRFVNNFKAFDVTGKELEVKSLSANRWQIKGATSLHRIAYWVDDTFDSELDNPIFEPGGTNIEEGKNFLLNTFGVFGYIDGMKNQPYEVNITRPDNFYGATSMILKASKGNTDTYVIDNYFDLADAPIMYCVPDTTTMQVGGAEILVSVYSPNKKLSSSFVMDNVSEILTAQKEYLGGKLPIEKYAFIIYLTDGTGVSGGMGALEHSYSSVYYLPEMEPANLTQTIKDVAAHEFFHIVTPLNIHSEEIGDFNFIEPEMSKHLWLYEGSTEYAAHHVQVKHGLVGVEDYLETMSDKMKSAGYYNDTLPFTVMSSKCLDEHEKQYGNVYQKGALITMCLDIKLRHLSGGKYGTQELIKDLSKTYGKHKSFKDEELFDKIEELTYPEIREFLDKYVAGPNPLPFQEVLNLVGIEYHAALKTKRITMGGIRIGYNPETSRLLVQNTLNLNKFGKDMGYKDGDEWVLYNGQELNATNYQKVLEEFSQVKPGKKVKMVVARKQSDGTYKNVKLKAKAMEIEADEQHVMQLKENATPEEVNLRKAWIGQ